MLKYSLVIPLIFLIGWLMLALVAPWLPLHPQQITLPQILQSRP
jgi:hypothetical protein